MRADQASVGGFFPLDLGVFPGGGAFTSVADRWFAGAAATIGFRNARSALACGVCAWFAPIRTLWLPDYLCRAMTDGAEQAVAAGHVETVRRYPLAPEGSLSPEPAWLASDLRSGDAVVVPDYFGDLPSPALRHLAATRRDVTWIEDRAQALWPGDPWGDAVLYSPRKLMGVPDGGFAVLPRAHPRARPDGVRTNDASTSAEALWPALARFEDPGGRAGGDWFAAYRHAEAAMRTDPAPCSRLTRDLLARLDVDAMAARRRANRDALVALLPPETELLAAGDSSAPQGVPVRVPDAAATGARLAAAGVFCPVLWPDIPLPLTCERTRSLLNRVLLLPCDHRCEPADMARVAATFAGAAA